KGDGTFAAGSTIAFSNNALSLSAGDFNGDGHTDLATAVYNFSSVSVALNNGDGTFAAPVNYIAGPTPEDVVAVDVNHDGKTDLVAANSISSGSISVLMGNRDGTFQSYHSY